MRITARAHAKINLGWRVMPVDESGYHPVNGAISTIDLHDLLVFEGTDGSAVGLECHGSFQVGSGTNLIETAAELIRPHATKPCGVSITCTKNIPIGAGLGGGSADAAATLVALNLLWSCGLGARELVRLGAQIGSDVPALLVGGRVEVSGYGEVVRSVESAADWAALLVWPGFGLSTAEVYRAFDDLEPLDATGTHHNDLQMAAVKVEPRLGDVLNAVGEVCGDVFMTGSGSAVVGMFGSSTDAEVARARIQGSFPWTQVVQPTESGVTLTVG